MQHEKAVQHGGAKKGNGPATAPSGQGTENVHPRDIEPSSGEASEAPPPRRAKSIGRDALLLLFKKYDALDAEYQQAALALLAVKVRRSEVVEEIYFGSPEKKSFKMKDKGDQIWTIMTREDKKEASPTLGKRFYFFRRPSTFDPLEI